MKLESLLVKKIFPALKAAGPDKVILGQAGHARRITESYTYPSYVERISYPRHDKPELCVCYKGHCVVRLDNHHYRLEPLDACLVGRNVYHFESYFRPEQEYQILWFFFPVAQELVVNHCRYRNEAYTTLAGLHCPVKADAIGQLDSVLTKGLSWPEVKPRWDRFLGTIEEGIRSALGGRKDISMPTDRTNYNQKRVDQVWEYVHDHLAEEIKVEDMAKHLGLNTNYFQTFFHKAVGSTFVQYLTTHRLRKAQELLNDSSLNISEIAQQCGYADPYYFSRVFRKHCGLSPRQFRDKY